MARSVYIVASTLPIAFFVANEEAFGTGTIVTTSANLTLSYRYLASKKGRVLTLRTAPVGFLKQSLYFAWLVARCCLFRYRLVIFHECCMPVLDLLILALKPSGEHFPQVSMMGSIPVEISAAPRSKLLILLRLLGLSRFFTLYYSPPVGDNPGEYSLSINRYPASIISHPIGYRGNASGVVGSGLRTHTRAVLLLTGKSFSNDEEQLSIFRSIADIAVRKGFRCDVKDHPNPYFRLGFARLETNVIDPALPSELLEDDYALVLGTSSTALLGYGNRAYSVVELLPSLSFDERALAKKHFDMTAPGHELRYLASLKQLETILEELNP